MDTKALAQNLATQIGTYVSQEREHIIADLQHILRFNTVSGGKSEAEQQQWREEIHHGFAWLGQKAEEANLSFKNIEDTVCYLEQPGGSETLGMLLHLDVVPPGEGWSHPPFGGELDGGIVFGRGCQDDKGPIVQCFHALMAAKSLNLPFRRSVRLIVGSEEETGIWADVKRYLEVEPAPAFSIVPDGAFPIVNGEKGMVDIQLSRRALAPESGEIQLVSLTSGVRSNVVPPLAGATLQCTTEKEDEVRLHLAEFLQREAKAKAEASFESGRLTLQFFGKNAHGSMPQEGQNAARDLLNFLAELPLEGPRADFARLLAALVRDDAGASLGIANQHEFIGATTQSLGIVNIDSICEAVINIRHTPPQDTNAILENVAQAVRSHSEAAADCVVAFHGKKHEPLFVDPQNHPEYFEALEAAYTQVTGREAKRLAIGGTTFAKAFPNAMCFGPTDPAEEDELAHQSDERIHIEHHLRNVRIYALALALLALDFS